MKFTLKCNGKTEIIYGINISEAVLKFVKNKFSAKHPTVWNSDDSVYYVDADEGKKYTVRVKIEGE